MVVENVFVGICNYLRSLRDFLGLILRGHILERNNDGKEVPCKTSGESLTEEVDETHLDLII
jgi:hypothetical protein